MTRRLNFTRFVLGATALVLFAGGTAWAQVYSHARVVRLSFEEGTVSLARPDAPNPAEASVNTPIQEGFKLTTADESFAEVEFENSSTARVGQHSELDFNQLALDPNGGKLNAMTLAQGYATFNITREDGDVYTVTAGAANINLGGDKLTRFRVDLDGDNVRVEVFKGAVEVTSPFGGEHLGKNNVLEMHPGADEPMTVAHGITKDAWDQWVEEREDQAQVARRRSPPGLYTHDVNSLLYGWNDLYYYGNWAAIPGYGYGWIPAMGFGWAPYSNGQWMWYPGFGYTWVSFEPWGWLPFHYGGWVYDPNFGWCWIPGGFNMWSPSLVNWYQGSGWVGWAPLPPRPRPAERPAPSIASGFRTVPSGVTVMSTENFRLGMPIPGRRMSGVTVTGSDAVSQPSVQPDWPARSHQSPAVSTSANQAATGIGAASAGAVMRPGTGASGVRAAAPARQGLGSRPAATTGSVVYDPAEGRYVNNGEASAPAAKVESSSQPAEPPAVSVPAHPAAPASSVQPAPGASRQVPGPQAAPEAGHHAAPSMGIDSSRSTGTFEKTLNSWGAPTPAGRAPSRSSGGWSAPASRDSVGSGGGGRSSGASGNFGGGGGMGGGGRSGGGGSTPHR